MFTRKIEDRVLRTNLRHTRGQARRQAARWTSRRTSALTALAAAIMVILAPYGGASTRAAAAGNVTLKLWTLSYQGGNGGVQGIADDFQKANPGVTIQYTYRPDQTYKDTIRAALQTSAAPDVLEIYTGLAFSEFFAQNGVVRPLDQYYRMYNWTKRFGVLSDTTIIGGKHYGVPWSAGPLALFYRKDLFTKAHISAPPRTYADLVGDMDKLKASGVIPLAIGGKFSWNTLYITDNLLEHFCGTAVFNKLRSFKLKWTAEPCVTRSFTELKSWVTKGYLPSGFLALDPNSGESNGLMYSGRAAMVFAGGWMPPALKQAGQDQAGYGVFGFPNGTGRQYEGSGQFQISTRSQHPALAAKFIDFAMSVPEQSKYYGTLNGVVSVTAGAVPSGPLAVRSPLGPPMASMLTHAAGLFTTTDLSTPPSVYAAVFQAQDSIVAGKLASSAAAKMIQDAINRQ